MINVVIHFGANNPKFPYTLSGNVLPVVEIYKDLGIVIEAGLSFSNHINHLVRKCFVMSKLLLKSFSRENPQLLASLFRTPSVYSPNVVLWNPFLPSLLIIIRPC